MRANLVQFSLTDGDSARLKEEADLMKIKPNFLARDIVRKHLKERMIQKMIQKQ